MTQTTMTIAKQAVAGLGAAGSLERHIFEVASVPTCRQVAVARPFESRMDAIARVLTETHGWVISAIIGQEAPTGYAASYKVHRDSGLVESVNIHWPYMS